MEVAWPLFAIVGFAVKVIDKVAFSWWLGPLIQRKANQALSDDVQASLYFLYSKAQLVKDKPLRVLPFDYSSIVLVFENVRFCFTRGRDELTVSLAPRNTPEDGYELPIVIAALDSKEITEVGRPARLAEIADLLCARLGEINEAYSQPHYPELKKRLAALKKGEQAVIRQVQWELNKSLYRS